MTIRRETLALWLERVLFATGVACVTWCAVTLTEASWWQSEQRRILNEAVTTPVPVVGHAETDPALSRIRRGDPVGQLEVPRLDLRAVIIEGDDEASLKVAVGHLPDTPLPWESGNTALAAHRDTFFRPLKDIRIGDVLRVLTRSGAFDYRVRETLIVDPEDVWVLDATDRPMMTLITCYPFHAPERFIVRAERIESARTRFARDQSDAN
jgi:sortase A